MCNKLSLCTEQRIVKSNGQKKQYNGRDANMTPKVAQNSGQH